MKRSLIYIFILILCLSGCSQYSGVKAVYINMNSPEIQQRYGGEMGALADELKEAGVTRVLVPVLNDGTAFYPSDILPRRWENGTQILALRHELRRRNIDLYTVVQIFRDAYTYLARPEIRPLNQLGKNHGSTYLSMVCPSYSDYQSYKLELISEIMLIFQPDGLVLRDCYYPVKWQDIRSVQDVNADHLYGFNDEALLSFARFIHMSLPKYLSGTYETGEWIQTYHREDWVSWKCEQITRFVEKTAETVHGYAPDCRIVLEVIPWKQKGLNDALRYLGGVDLKTLSIYVDDVIPLYGGRSVSAFDELDELILDQQAQGVTAVPQLDIRQFHNEEQFKAARRHYLENSVVNSWEMMLKYRRYLNVYQSE